MFSGVAALIDAVSSAGTLVTLACGVPASAAGFWLSGGLTMTSAPSFRRAKPVVTTMSDGATPLVMTASVSSCWPTLIGRVDALLSAPTR